MPIFFLYWMTLYCAAPFYSDTRSIQLHLSRQDEQIERFERCSPVQFQVLTLRFELRWSSMTLGKGPKGPAWPSFDHFALWLFDSLRLRLRVLCDVKSDRGRRAAVATVCNCLLSYLSSCKGVIWVVWVVWVIWVAGEICSNEDSVCRCFCSRRPQTWLAAAMVKGRWLAIRSTHFNIFQHSSLLFITNH